MVLDRRPVDRPPRAVPPRGPLDQSAPIQGCRGAFPLAPRRTAPVLQRRPDAAREAEAIDRGRRSQRLEAMQLNAAPLEAAFLQDVARGRVGDPRARDQVLDIEFLEGEIDCRPRRFGAKTLAPMLEAEPVAEFRRVRLAPVDADDAAWRVIVFDQAHT